MSKSKLQQLSLLLGIVALYSALTVPATFAAYNPISRNLCTLMVKPFNVALAETTGAAGTQYINYLSEATCKNFVDYGEAYSPQPPLKTDNPLKAGVDPKNVNVPITRHDHNYYNDSVQDNYYYKSFVDKFEITLQSDAFDSINFNEIWCDTPVPYGYSGDDVNTLADCEGIAGDLWGGTVISKDFDNNAKTLTITWDFAFLQDEDNNFTGRPGLWGNNGSNYLVYDENSNSFTLDTTDENNRKLPFSVHMGSKDNHIIWSATTTSKVLLADLSIKKSNYLAHHNDGCVNEDVNNAGSGWCYLAPKAGFDTEPVTTAPGKTRTYYWFDIGSVVTVWQEPIIPIIIPFKGCSALDITPTGPLSENNLPQTFTVTPTTFGGQTVDYEWVATQNNTVSFNGVPYIGIPFTNTSTQTIVDKLKALTTPITLTVTAVDKADHSKKFQNCQKSVVINPAPPQLECIDISLQPPGPNFAESSFANGIPFTVTGNAPGIPLDFKWTANQNNVVAFDGTAYTGTPYFDTQNPNLVTLLQTLNAPLTLTVQAVNKANHAIEYSGNCQKTITVTPEQIAPMCEALNLKVNGVASSNSVSINEGDTVTLQATPDPSNIFTWVRWTETGDGFFSNVANTSQICQDILNSQANFATPSSNISFVAPATCSYNYTGADNSSAQVGASPITRLGTLDVSQCQASIIAEANPPPPSEPYCQDLVLSPSTLDDDGNTVLNATVIFGNSNGESKTASIQWTGDGSFGNAGSGFTQTATTTGSSLSFSTVFDADDAFQDGVHVETIGQFASSACEADAQPPQPPEEQCDYLDAYRTDDEVCINVDSDYEGTFTWKYDGKTLIKNDPDYCLDISDLPPNAVVNVYATDDRANCEDRLILPTQPPELEKTVSKTGKGDYEKVISISPQTTYVDYRLIFTAHSPNTTAEITDTIGERGGIRGETNPGNLPAGHIEYADSQKVSIDECDEDDDEEDWENCYTGDIGDGDLVLHKVDGRVIITYKGRLKDSAITDAVCKEGKVCQERYPNEATADYTIYDNDNDEVDSGSLNSEALVQIFCQYILTRAAGDIFLETDLNAGVDIRVCSKFKTVPGIIIKPGEIPLPRTPTTGAGDTSTIFGLTNEICSKGQAGTLDSSLTPFYGKDVSKLSSQICEVKLNLGKDWKQSIIANSIEETKLRISRWEADFTTNATISQIKLDDDYADQKVYHIKGANLTIDQEYILANGEGAKTFIIEDGDLIINKASKYGACNRTDNTCTVSETASLAFIVLNGSVYVDPNVPDMAGVYYVQEGDRAGSGRLYSGSPRAADQYSEVKLNITGSVYGDIDPLFSKRTFAGDPSEEGGGIVIRFDERIILNTPPGLRDVISLSETEVAR